MIRLFDLDDLATHFGTDRETVLALVRRGDLPAPVFTRRLVRWTEHQLHEWTAAGCPACPPPKAEVFHRWRHRQYEETLARYAVACEGSPDDCAVA